MKKNHYGFFSSQNGTGKTENERKKNILVPIHSNTTRNREFQKNNQKLQKIKKHCYGFVWTRNGIGPAEIERKKKIIVSIHSILTRNRDFQKNSKKIQKIKKHYYGFFSSQNRTGEDENVRKKKLSFWSVQNSPGIGNSKKIAKKFKKFKNINMASFKAKTGREMLRMWEKKNCSCQFQANPKYRILKI